MPNTHFRIAALFAWLVISALAFRATGQQPEKAAPAAKGQGAAKTLDHEAILRLLQKGNPMELRQAAESLQKSPPKEREELLAAAEAVKSALSMTRDATAEAALRLALGRLGAAGVEDAAEWGFESMSVTHRPTTPPKVFESHVQALEMVPGAAKELMLGNLEVALNMEDVELQERQRLKEFVTLTAEGMRTRELAIFLDALLTGEEDLFVKIEAPLEERLIRCYQNVKAKPPINADAVIQWLEKHPGGPPEVEITALETVSLVGTTKPEALTKLAERLLVKPENAVMVARRLIGGHVDRSLLPQVKDALRKHAAKDPNGEAATVLAELNKLPR
jgi:hypothetical protein